VKIKKKVIRKLIKAVERQIRLTQPFIRGGQHLTSKSDKLRKTKNTIKNWEE